MKKNFRNTILGCGYTFIYLPLIFLVIFSFNRSKLPGVWTEGSFHWYKELFQDEHLIQAALTSFRIGSISATLSVILGLMAALSSKKKQFQTASSLLLTMPDLILALSLLLVFISIERHFHLQRSAFTLIVGHVTLSFSYVYLMIKARLKDFNPHLEEAALDLGARPFQVFFSIKFPFLMPTFLTSWFLAFALSFDDVILASFLAGPSATTLPLVIFSSLRLGISPEVSALASLLIVAITLILIMIIGYVLWNDRREKNKYFKL